MSEGDSDKKPEARTLRSHAHKRTCTHIYRRTLTLLYAAFLHFLLLSLTHLPSVFPSVFLFLSFLPTTTRTPYISLSLSLFPSAGFPQQTVSVAAIEFPWMRMSDREQVHGAADASGESDYQSLLLLGAIAAASAFVVTILIVLICVGCQR